MSYDLPHEPVPKLMNSCDLVPICDKLATGSKHQTLCECSQTIRNKVQSFCTQYCMKSYMKGGNFIRLIFLSIKLFKFKFKMWLNFVCT